MNKHPSPVNIKKYGEIVVLDGGARNGPKDLKGLSPICHFHCFEPNDDQRDSVEAGELRVQDGDGEGGRLSVYPYALSKESGETTLNISVRPGSTSTLEPNVTLLERFSSDHFSEMRNITSRIQVPSITVSDFMKVSHLEHIDFIKLDTQGNELDILKSAGDYLNSTSVVMVEVEMIPLYENQPLFHDVSKFMQDHGFEFVDLQSVPSCRRFHARDDFPPSSYRLVWGDAIYARRLDDPAKPRTVQQGLVLAGLGYADIAIDLWSKNPELNNQDRNQLEIFARWAVEPHYFSGKIRRFIERKWGVLLQRYNWRRGHQVRSVMGN